MASSSSTVVVWIPGNSTKWTPAFFQASTEPAKVGGRLQSEAITQTIGDQMDQRIRVLLSQARALKKADTYVTSMRKATAGEKEAVDDILSRLNLGSVAEAGPQAAESSCRAMVLYESSSKPLPATPSSSLCAKQVRKKAPPGLMMGSIPSSSESEEKAPVAKKAKRSASKTGESQSSGRQKKQIQETATCRKARHQLPRLVSLKAMAWRRTICRCSIPFWTRRSKAEV